MRSWPRWKRLAFAAVVSPTLVGSAASLLFYANLHRSAAAMSTEHLPSFPPLKSPQRLLILAPHCDDETLGAGGLIAEARRRNLPVTVAFLTNGDAFPAACAIATKKVTLQSTDYIRFGELRQKEALAALQQLGVTSAQTRFLSYPDRGLKPLWETSWSSEHLFRSTYTAANHSPFTHSFTPNAAYCGQSVRNDLVRLIEEVRPTDVFVTHPADDHADHSTAAAFTQAALEQVRSEGHIPPPALHYYLVHRGDWPLPQGLAPNLPLVPPAGLTKTDTLWYTFPLSEHALRAKEAALEQYTSQLELCGRQLRSFLRQNELFAQLPVPTLAQDTPATAPDAVRDDVVRYANPATDLVDLQVTQRKNTLEVRVRLRGGVTPGVRYALRLHTDQGLYLTEPLKVPQLPPPGTTELIRKLPLTRLETNGKRPQTLWISAETGITNRYIVDQTGYRQFHLSPSPDSAE